jgi:hypothetical protein
MAFDFSKAKQEAAKDLNNKKLGLLVLGASGSGKSTVAGTFGVKTLYLYTSGEVHGSQAASAVGDKVTPICIDYADGNQLSADASYERLQSVLNDVAGIKAEGFEAVVVDGATELETLIRGTSRWKALCSTKDGSHNAFAEGAATLAMFRPIIDGLKTLQRQIGAHYAMTCILDVQSLADDGEITQSKPRLNTYSVAEGIVQQFSDIVAIGRMTNGDTAMHRFQFLAGVSRESKDARGNIKKTINFHPRLAGVTLEKLPVSTKADMKELIKLKGGK